MTCLSGPASLSDDVGSEWWFLVLLNVFHCLCGLVAHPMQLHTGQHVACYLLMYNSLVILVGKGKVLETLFKKTDGTSQHIHIRGFIYMIECWQRQSNGKCPFLRLLQEGRNPNIQHLGRESWNQLPPQPEPKIATYLQSIIVVVLDCILSVRLCSFNSQLPSILLTISV